MTFYKWLKGKKACFEKLMEPPVYEVRSEEEADSLRERIKWDQYTIGIMEPLSGLALPLPPPIIVVKR